MEYLSEQYPRLFVHILEFFEVTDRIEEYIYWCKTYEHTFFRFSLYLHGYFYLWLD